MRTYRSETAQIIGGGKQYFASQQHQSSGQPTIVEIKPGELKQGEHVLQSSMAPTTTTMVTSRQPQMVIVQQQQGQPGQLPMQILEEHGGQQHG